MKNLSDRMPTFWILCGDRWPIDARQLLLARELRIIEELPGVSRDQIVDLNKEDLFVELLAICQIVWLCIQLVTRLFQEVPATQLEVVTLGFAVCSAITYCLLRHRPKDGQTVFHVEAGRYPSLKELICMARPTPGGGDSLKTSIANDETHLGSDFVLSFAASVAVIVFGGVHFAAWNSTFPTRIGETLWRANAIVTVAVIPAMCWHGLLGRLGSMINSLSPHRLDVS